MTVFDYVPSEDLAWRADARCATDETAPSMFPNELNRPAVRDAKIFCQTCPVRNECLDEALDRGERHGIWGGMDAHERASLRRRTSRMRKSA